MKNRILIAITLCSMVINSYAMDHDQNWGADNNFENLSAIFCRILDGIYEYVIPCHMDGQIGLCGLIECCLPAQNPQDTPLVSEEENE